MPKKLRQKFKCLENERAFKMKQKAFFTIFEGLSLKKIIKLFFEGESPTLRGFLWFSITMLSILVQELPF